MTFVNFGLLVFTCNQCSLSQDSVKGYSDVNQKDENSTVKDYLTVQKEGNRKIKRTITVYNLDMILAIGYRVRSARGTQFRR